MTNAQIIFENQIALASEGILKVDDNGDIQPIHTYNAWKARGFQVKKGEKAVAKFPIWKYSNSKKNDDEASEADGENEVQRGRCFMKMSAFFTDEQVEPIKEKEVA